MSSLKQKDIELFHFVHVKYKGNIWKRRMTKNHLCVEKKEGKNTSIKNVFNFHESYDRDKDQALYISPLPP